MCYDVLCANGPRSPVLTKLASRSSKVGPRTSFDFLYPDSFCKDVDFCPLGLQTVHLADPGSSQVKSNSKDQRLTSDKGKIFSSFESFGHVSEMYIASTCRATIEKL